MAFKPTDHVGPFASDGRAEDQDPAGWVQLKRFIDSQDAHILRSFLDAHGIENHMAGDNMSAIHPGVQPAIFIRARDRFRVHHLLKERRAEAAKQGFSDGISMPRLANEAPHIRPSTNITGEEVYCPTCGSHWVSPI